MIVIDASALVDILLRPSQAQALRRRVFTANQLLHAPHLLDIEVAQVLSRFVGRGEIAEQRGAVTLGDLASLRLRRYPHGLLLERVWQLRHNVSAYDASYVALAELLDMPLITRDARLASATGHRARIEVF